MTTYQDCLDEIKEHSRRSFGEDLQRPLTQLESQIVYGLYSFSAFADFGRDVMERRNRAIPRAKARLGLIRWACRSLFDDYITQLSPEGRKTFQRRMTDRETDGYKLCRDIDLEALASSAWHGTCQYCALKGIDAKKCRLRKTFDALQCLEPSDSKDCWYQPVE